ncbi:Eco57I restriction-modification methylase domain-containing protein [Aerococcus urinaeequi]|uniref:Eco57I restriction-modification methylase domain-containing protein n=1 Tax=Aerococcus urinaeequi TaxID=51665 RepID=UPI003D6C656B
MLTTTSLSTIEKLVKKLSRESDKWMSLAIAIDLADEILKVLLPANQNWIDELTRDTQNTGNLPKPLPLDTFKNQKQVKWFNSHPESASARSAFKLFHQEDSALESNFFWFSESATKQKIAAATEYSKNWEDSELTRKPEYKVGIDFFLTPDANSLLLVISNHQKLRVLELHGHLSNTQKQIFKDNLNGAAAYIGIENGKQLEFEPQRTIHTTLWNALQLKEVNKQFYGYIAEHFTELVEVLRNENGKSLDDAKQFSSRLLGRLLFIWFLRKMDIINEEVGYFETKGLNSSEYYEKQLKNLFFNTLNTEKEERNNGDLLTPYLNGGLFEAKENDFETDKLVFPDNFFERLYDHFNEFNFTTDESSADFELIAVDPEMLGQVFESLLASQSDDNESNERNKTGSFYTPREIVGYMVKETLRQYLYSKIEGSSHRGIDELLDLSDSQWLDRKSTSNADVWGVNSKSVIAKIKIALDNFKVLDPAVGSGAFPMGMLQQLLKTYERIEPRFDPYKLKLSIIENNLFGIDIQPMAIEISRLRAWLSVIVDQENKDDIKPLPNLEFKFIAANSLVKLKDGQGDIFADPELDLKLQDLRDKYFNARKSNSKKEYQRKYYQLTTGQINIFEDDRTRQLKSFDPFKNRYPAEFFDSRVMFGVKEGFDAVIGNPPYIHFETMDKPLRDFYNKNAKKLGFSSYAARGDIYTLFYEKGIQLLKQGGILTYITSNKWMRASYGAKLRDFFVKDTNPLFLVDLGAGIFDSATVDTNILILQKGNNEHNVKAIKYAVEDVENMSVYIRQHAVNIDYKVGESWVILNEIEQSIKRKVESKGIPLKEWDVKINRGILTGLNEAFIITKEKRDELIREDSKSAEIIRPILRGRDIKRYSYSFANLYVITAYKGINAIIKSDYPAIFNHLKQFEQKLKQRGQVEGKPDRPGSNQHHWTELDNNISLEKLEDFSKQKIIYPNMTKYLPFYLDNKSYLTNQKAFIIIGEHLATLTAFFNSSLFKFVYSDNFPELQGGTRELSKIFFEKLVIKYPTDEHEQYYQDLVAKIQTQKQQNLDTTILEKTLDDKFFEEYELNDFEKKTIKQAIKKLNI